MTGIHADCSPGVESGNEAECATGGLDRGHVSLVLGNTEEPASRYSLGQLNFTPH